MAPENKYYIKREKEFIELLELISEKSLEKVEEAIKTLQKLSPLDITTEKIKTIINRRPVFSEALKKECEPKNKRSQGLRA